MSVGGQHAREICSDCHLYESCSWLIRDEREAQRDEESARGKLQVADLFSTISICLHLSTNVLLFSH